MGTTIGELAAAIGNLPRLWWVVALRGVAAIVFGITALIWPGITLAVLVLLFGAYAIVDGVLALYAAVRSGGRNPWASLLEGILGIIAGLVAFVWPGLTALTLVILIGAWAIVTGVLEVIAAVRLRKVVKSEWTLGFGGVLSVLFGVLLFAQPGAGALAMVWIIGAYSVIFGVAVLGLALRLRSLLAYHTHAGAAGTRQTSAVEA